ncbi:MAG: hypothetical protein R3B70_20980 [Polyangiaceae bacterium]
MTAVKANPRESIAAFALLKARLSDPFANRDVLLAMSALDEEAFAGIEARWCQALAKGDADAERLATEYGDAFSAALGDSLQGKSAVGAAPLSREYEARAEKAAVANEAPASVVASPPGPVLGFSESAQARPVDVPSFLRETPMSTGTAAVDLASILKKSVPFDPFARPSPAVESAPAPAAPAPSGSTETTDVDVAAIARRVLAFGPPGSRGAPPASPPVQPQAPSPSMPVRVVVRPPEGPRSPSFTLDQYALLSAEMAYAGKDPAARAAVLVRFGVTHADALTAEWRARFEADPALSGRWSAAYAHHYARLRAERG